MAGPQEFARRVDRNADITSAKDDALEELAEWIPKQLPFGSVALLRVDSSEHRGQDVVPVIVARKAACPWISSEHAVDGNFRPGDIIVWVVDLPLAQERRQRQEYLVPNSVSGVKFRAVPLTCIAGLGQGLSGYMEHSPYACAGGSSACRYVLREGMVEDARSRIVLLSTNPSAAFKGFEGVPFSVEDERRAKVAKKLFPDGTVVRQAFKGPTMPNGKLLWKKKKQLTAVVVICKTDSVSRRHQYRLKWEGEVFDLVLAEVQEFVDEGFVEQYYLETQ